MTVFAWHFARRDMRLEFGDGRLIVPGETLTVDCEPKLRAIGLHASDKLIDALDNAAGPMICRVRVGGRDIEWGGDLVVGTTRTCLWAIDGDRLLRSFACICATRLASLAGCEDSAVIGAILVAERHLRGEATDDELSCEHDRAWTYAMRSWLMQGARDELGHCLRLIAAHACKRDSWSAASHSASDCCSGVSQLCGASWYRRERDALAAELLRLVRSEHEKVSQ